MDPERWRRIESLFHAAVDLEPDAREALLAAGCGADAELRAAVERLIRDDAEPRAFLERGAVAGSPESDPLLGRRIGAFRLSARLGAGGMGVVYRAGRADGLFEQEVAVKLIRAGAATGDLLRRFERERRTLAALSHPNIARLLDGGTTDDGSPYLVMELIEGAPIDRFCDERHLAVEQRLELFVPVCRAVHFAHTNLVIHRDLKPGNILVDAQGVPKLLDFGIARLLADPTEEERELTRTLSHVMTPEYASPEQHAGGPITTATDVYSLGVVLYGLLTGRKPFRVESESPAAWERAVKERAPVRPSTAVLRTEQRETPSRAALDPRELAARFASTPARLRRRLAGDLDRIVLMTLRKEPERRYSSARELADDLERHLAGKPVIAREDSALYRASKFVERHRIAVGAAVLVLAALVFAVVTARKGERKAQKGLAHARIEAASFRLIAEYLTADFLSARNPLGPEERELALQKIQRQAERVRRQWQDDPHKVANLLDALGRVCAGMELYDEGRALCEEAHELRRRTFGEQDLEVALSLRSLGDLSYRRGAFAEAAQHFERALELHRTLERGTHTDVALAANDLARALRALGRLDRAETLHREALELRRAEGRDALAIAESSNDLARVLLDRSEHAEAASLLAEGIQIMRASGAADRAELGRAERELATCLLKDGRPIEAAEHVRAALELLDGAPRVAESELRALREQLAALDAPQNGS